MEIRSYRDSDYEAVQALYKNSALYGGEFDENRDSRQKLLTITQRDPNAILVCMSDSQILGTVSLIEDGRVAWLFRFAVSKGEHETEATKLLYQKSIEILKSRGHNQVLVYSPANDQDLSQRYSDILGFEKGADYTCFWKNI